MTKILPEALRPRSSVFTLFDKAIIVTTNGIYSWTSDGIKELFRSGSGGIVAARQIHGPQNLLAVADSQVVILHDVDKGQQKSYRLKRTDGNIRLLEYSKNAELLYFTTSLQDAVQSYSLSKERLLNPAHAHPSPPTAFALSSDSNILLSASAAPPTIYLQDLQCSKSSILLKPDSSSAAVVSVSFHPENPTIFALDFADGTLSVFNASYLFRAKGRTERSAELWTVHKLHAVGPAHPLPELHQGGFSRDRSYRTRIAVGDPVTSVVSIAFLPGSEHTTISVGSDGKCCIVKLTLQGPAVRKWDVGGVATTLSLLKTGSERYLQLDGTESTDAYHRILAAIGRNDGLVQIFDLDGRLIDRRDFDKSGPVLHVECLNYSDDDYMRRNQSIQVRTQAKNTPKTSTPARSQSLKTLFAEVHALAEITDDTLISATLQQPLACRSNSSESAGPVANPPTKIPQQDSKSDTRFTPIRLEQAATWPVTSLEAPPTVPPRPMPRKGGKLAERQAARAARSSSSRKASEIRRKAMEASGRYKAPSFQQPAKPRSPNDTNPLIRGLDDSGNQSQQYFPTLYSAKTSEQPFQVHHKPSIPVRLHSVAQSTTSHFFSSQDEASTDTIIDWAPASAKLASISKPPAAPSETRSGFPITIISQMPSGLKSMTSNNTIVDWHPAKGGTNNLEDIVSSDQESPTNVSRKSTEPKRKVNGETEGRGGDGVLREGVGNHQAKRGPVFRGQRRESSGASKKVAQGEKNKPNDANGQRKPPGEDLLRTALREELAIFDGKISRQFEQQRMWFNDFTRERDEWGRKLEEENRLLREELSRQMKRSAKA